jgi:hypothetical protein
MLLSVICWGVFVVIFCEDMILLCSSHRIGLLYFAIVFPFLCRQFYSTHILPHSSDWCIKRRKLCFPVRRQAVY